MCIAYIFTKLWTGKFFGLLARTCKEEDIHMEKNGKKWEKNMIKI
jgi:hypothetical protein